MEGRKQLHMDRHKEVTNGWYHDTACTLISLPVWNWFLGTECTGLQIVQDVIQVRDTTVLHVIAL